MSKGKKKVGRPQLLADNDVVFVTTRDATSKLQVASDRRAIVNRLVEFGGKASIEELNESFGYDVRATVLALVKIKWLAVAANSES